MFSRHSNFMMMFDYLSDQFEFCLEILYRNIIEFELGREIWRFRNRAKAYWTERQKMLKKIEEEEAQNDDITKTIEMMDTIAEGEKIKANKI